MMKHDGGEFLMLDGQMLTASETMKVIEQLRTRIAVMTVQMEQLKADAQELTQELKELKSELD